MHRLLLSSILAFAMPSVIAVALQARSAVSTYTYDQVLFPGSDATEGRGINDRGQIVGTYFGPASGRPHGFLLTNGAFAKIDDVPDALDTIPMGLNNRGEIIGIYTARNEGRPAHSFLLSHNNFISIDVPGRGKTQTNADGINDLGQVVGSYVDETGVHGFLWSNGSFTTIDAPGALTTGASDINNRGDIVGAYVDVPPATGRATNHGFVFSDGRFTTIDIPSAIAGEFIDREINTAVRGINDRGDLVGDYTDALGAVHGFELSRGAFAVIDPPDGGTLSSAQDVNNRGEIVGYYSVPFQNLRGFLATPMHGS
jgi:probable HAF family extracellular repeat protein